MADRFAVVEMMGHRRFGARISEAEEFGARFIRCEILVTSGDPPVQLVHPQSVYAITECTEDAARRVNADTWQLRQAVPGLPEPTREPVEGETLFTCNACDVNVTESDIKRDASGRFYCSECRSNGHGEFDEASR